MKLSIQDYVAKISTASPLQLVVIQYELFIDHTEEAILNIEAELCKLHILKAQAVVKSLITSLDMSIPISKNLFLIYIYVNKLQNEAMQTKRIAPLQEALAIMKKLLEGWLEISNVENGQTSLFDHTQQVFAGLTYGKDGHLAEYLVDNQKRGYKA